MVRKTGKVAKAPGRPNLPVGTEKVYTNGYTYVRTREGWRLKHHVLAEELLGRPLHKDERAYFKDGDRTNLTLDNVRVQVKVNHKERRIEQIVNQIAALEDELKDLLA